MYVYVNTYAGGSGSGGGTAQLPPPQYPFKVSLKSRATMVHALDDFATVIMPDYYHTLPYEDLLMRKRQLVCVTMSVLQRQLYGGGASIGTVEEEADLYRMPDYIISELGKDVEARRPLTHVTTVPEDRRYKCLRLAYHLACLMWDDCNWTLCTPPPVTADTLYVFTPKIMERRKIFSLMDRIRSDIHELCARWNDPITYRKGAHRINSAYLPVPCSFVQRNALISQCFSGGGGSSGSADNIVATRLHLPPLTPTTTHKRVLHDDSIDDVASFVKRAADGMTYDRCLPVLSPSVSMSCEAI